MSHSRLSPSRAPRCINCPGSVREEEKYQSSGESNAAAIDGTHTHYLIERCFATGKDPKDFIGEELTDDDGSFTVDEERAERAAIMVDYVRENTIDELFIEESVSPEKFLGTVDCDGTADCIIVNPSTGTIEIVDYKDGANVVSVDTEQLLIYLLAAIALVEKDLFDFDELRVTIVQPKSVFQNEDAIRSKIIDPFELSMFTEKVKDIIDQINSDDAPLIPGDKQCKYCRHKGNCQALADKTMDTLGFSFDDLTKLNPNEEPNNLSDDDLQKFLDSADLIRNFLNGIEEEALNRIKSNIPVNGYKIVKGNGRRKWTQNETDVAEILNKMGIPKKDCYTQKVLSPAQVHKFKWTNKNGVKKQLTERQIERLDADYIEKTDGELTLVPESDSREAVNFDASGMFGDVSEMPDYLK